MKKHVWTVLFAFVPILWATYGLGESGKTAIKARVSDASQACMECHGVLNPGIVEGWRKSRHASVSPKEALAKPKLERRVSREDIAEPLKSFAVGCAECHGMNGTKGPDSFDHNGYRIHTVVSPSDCAVCHIDEADQYGRNLMSHAFGNLQSNPLYRDLMETVNGTRSFEKMKVRDIPSVAQDNAESCLYCHGTEVKVKGTRKVDTSMGEMEIPILSGWPNRGVGRINPDGSKGACTACHTRHQFSIEIARKPYTCAECHKGPDVPAYAVYEASKHGNILSSQGKSWNFSSVPWAVGRDFAAPSCAACHVSLLMNSTSKEVVAQRTHQMNDRLPWRIMGLIYAHPHPKSPDTTIIRNKGGLPLPTELTGEPAADFLIDGREQEKRNKTIQRVCLSCHSDQWVKGHFDRLEHTLKTTNAMTLAATQILLAAWEKGAARGPAQKDSIFNETIEKKWVEQWLFYGNSTRFASAMAGADYGVFANGRWHLNKNIQEMRDWLEFKLGTAEKKKGQIR
jgi:hydroxylamine dehydrogenase